MQAGRAPQRMGRLATIDGEIEDVETQLRVERGCNHIRYRILLVEAHQCRSPEIVTQTCI